MSEQSPRWVVITLCGENLPICYAHTDNKLRSRDSRILRTGILALFCLNQQDFKALSVHGPDE